jgi:stearoyl-CoA desaturase (delta-9 desaturase)
MFNGFLDLSFWGYLGATLLLTHITIASVTIFLHRAQAHRAVDLHPVVSHFFRFWLWLTTGMVTREWVAVHRKHHARCETPEDPHSPQVLGIRKVMLEGAELYRGASTRPELLETYGSGTPDDWLERHVYTGRNTWGIGLMLLIDLLLFGPIGLTIWAVQMIWIPFRAAGVINGVGHYRGYRNFDCPDASHNIVPWGILIGGEELHNNHHAYPGSARLSSRWWEFDIGWAYIRLLQSLGLARVNRVSELPRLDYGKERIDVDTVRALARNRMYVLGRYARTVTMPVWREELRNADASLRSVFKRARRALTRDYVGSESRQTQLQEALNNSQALRTVYEFRQRFQEIWQKRAVSPDNMVKALQEWCSQAEATGIKVLRDFADSLKNYTQRSAAA